MKESSLPAKISKQIAEAPTLGWYKADDGVKHAVKCISFQQYMNACLYDEKDGYYRSGPVRIGKEGDFYTSSGVGRVLAEILARYIHSCGLMTDKPLQLIEWGAGTGRLSAQIAAAGKELSPDWEERFPSVQIEDHPLHADAARGALSMAAGIEERHFKIITSEQAWEKGVHRQPGIVLANELLDAFPVHRVQQVEGELVELGVAGNAELGFYEVYMPLSDHRFNEWLERDGIQLKDGQRTEIHAAAADFLKRLGAEMTCGRLILIDYGHEAAEYAAEHRMNGTLMCYWRHQASDTPFERIGEQDITSHVPFTFVRHAAEEAGWELVSYTTQKQFLMDNGVFDLLQNDSGKDPFSETAKMNRAVRQLLLSDQMSESFKVMILDIKAQH
ncbi:class I SAM-dependent methyltransferase [Paenibacillus sp. sgz302251]|uniref:class I SAM-dependent methyltransferase n=1 Tax=Paenibacillus sp. sgz302251 TaxID=3414493 RepID=UPI003C7BC7BB